jgi:hypothetical protein
MNRDGPISGGDIMGMDFVEFNMRIEEEFDIEVTNDDLHSIVRDRDIVVGDYYTLLLKKLHFRDVGRYSVRLNYSLWIKLRATIHSVAHASLDDIRLSTLLEELFPRQTRRGDWEALRDASPYRIRGLDYPRWVRILGFLLALTWGVIEGFQIWQFQVARTLWVVLGIFALWMLFETYAKTLWMLAPLRHGFPSGMKTVKDLCRNVLSANYSEICNEADIPLDDRAVKVWEKLTEILAETVDRDAISFRSRMVKDLGMD